MQDEGPLKLVAGRSDTLRKKALFKAIDVRGLSVPRGENS